jgi:preflagellin peptidase FlaK
VGVSDLETGLWIAAVAVLLAGFAYASASDLRTREVTDVLWQVMGLLGVFLGALALAPGGALPVALWSVVGLLALQHMFSWDERLGEFGDRYADLIEGASYAAGVVVIALAAVRYGIGPSTVPYAAIALLLTILFARGLFQLGVLYGGADAKAVMVSGILVPTFAFAPWSPTSRVAALTAVVPFSVNLLMDAALASLAIPIAIALTNAARHEFSLRRGFTGFTIPVDELPDRFVWVRDPTVGVAREEEADLETSEDDRRRREEVAAGLRSKGVARVWVTPQIPFLVLLTAGALVALLAGNLVLDLLALV